MDVDYAETSINTSTWIKTILWAQAPKVEIEFWAWERVLEVEREKLSDRDRVRRLFIVK